jgi:dihydroorotase
METAFGVLNGALIRPGILSLNRVVQKLTVGPAGVLRLNKGTLSDGADADITLIDLERTWTVDAEKFLSRSRNCPWAGEELTGRVTETIVSGRLVYQEGKILV